MAVLRRTQRRGDRKARLADAALARVQEYAHVS
jgi:hypothetical protein